MAQAWGLDVARKVLLEWAEDHVSIAAQQNGLAVQFEGVEAWLLAQMPTTLAEAEHVLSVLEAFKSGQTQDLERLMKGGGEHRRDGVAPSRVSHSFAPRAYGPIGGRA